MDRKKINNSFKTSSIPTIVAVCLCLGILLGISITNYQQSVNEVQVASKKYKSILHLIEKEYVDSVEVEKLFEKSVKHMLSELDPHTYYVPNSDQLTKTSLDSDFEGIGIRYVIIRDSLFVVETIKGGPADIAGVLAGDRIISVADSNIVSITKSNTIYTLLRGEDQSEVDLGIYRKLDNSTKNVTIVRGKIPNQSVDLAYLINENTGFIKLNRFSQNSHIELRKKIELLTDQGMKNLILDLRNNGGGYLLSAVEICDEFLNPGREILFTKGRDQIKNIEKAKRTGLLEYAPLVILINENSASASEIVAGALQDNDRALIVGRRSFGKGLVQTPLTLFDGSELRLTTSRYHTPSGRCIQKPYEENYETYQNDYSKRLNSGEFFDENKIEVNDSLKYKTVNNRTVYGGGGISPDVFIPKDTSEYSLFLTRVYAQQLLLEYGILFSLKNEDLLKEYSAIDFANKFIVTEAILEEFLAFSTLHQVIYTIDDLNRSKNLIKHEIKANIAEAKWGLDGMYKVLNKKDPYVLESLDNMKRAKELKEGDF